MLRGFHHACVITSDYEETIRFYVDTLGLTLNKELYSPEKKRTKLELYLDGVYVLEVFVKEAFPNKEEQRVFTGVDHLSFQTDDIKAAVATLQKKGVETSDIMTDDSGKSYAFFYDPDGLKLELYHV